MQILVALCYFFTRILFRGDILSFSYESSKSNKLLILFTALILMIICGGVYNYYRLIIERMIKMKLNNGLEIPNIGLGTWLIDNDDVSNVIKDAV